jgi:hypothetical protein
LYLTGVGKVLLAPILRATADAVYGSAFIPGRVVGTTGYVDVSRLTQLPQIAQVAHHRRWLAYPVATGLRLPLSDIDPDHTLRLVASAHDVRPVGRVRIDGTTAYGFEAVFGPSPLGNRHASSETVAVYLTANGEPIRISTSTRNNPDTSPPIVVVVEDFHAVTTPLPITPPPPSQTQAITYSQAHALNLVP